MYYLEKIVSVICVYRDAMTVHVILLLHMYYGGAEKAEKLTTAFTKKILNRQTRW